MSEVAWSLKGDRRIIEALSLNQLFTHPHLREWVPFPDAPRFRSNEIIACKFTVLEGLHLEQSDTLQTNDDDDDDHSHRSGVSVGSSEDLQLINHLINAERSLENDLQFILNSKDDDFDRAKVNVHLWKAIPMADEDAIKAEKSSLKPEIWKEMNANRFDLWRIEAFAKRCERFAQEPRVRSALDAHPALKENVHAKIADALEWVKPGKAHWSVENKKQVYSLAIVRSVIEHARTLHVQRAHALSYRGHPRRRFSIGVHTDSESE